MLGYYGRFEPLYRLRELAGTTQSGTTLWGLARAAKQLGLVAKGYETDLEGLKTMQLPVILHWSHNHYVVLAEIKPNKVLLLDPKYGRRWLNLNEFYQHWTGKVLWLQPGEDFEPGRFMGERGVKGLLRHLVHYKGAKRVLFQLFIGTTLLGLLSLGTPILSQILFDQVLTLGQASLDRKSVV